MSQEISLTKIAVFKGKKVRKIIHNNEWWFSVVDVCGTLADSVDSGAYWRKLKQRLTEDGSEVVTVCHGLKLEASDRKNNHAFQIFYKRSYLYRILSSDQ